jgi:hypothetical protein
MRTAWPLPTGGTVEGYVDEMQHPMPVVARQVCREGSYVPLSNSVERSHSGELRAIQFTGSEGLRTE